MGVTISRRKFAQLLGAGAAAAVARPALTLAAPGSTQAVSSGVLRLSSNENPSGPSAKALRAMSAAFDQACRYPDEAVDSLAESLAQSHGVDRASILLGAGSGEILKLCADIYTGPLTNEKEAKPGGALVLADPSFEAILYHAKENGAEIVKVPLTADFAHDLPKMQAAAKKGLIYVCNPNNPTASISPKNEVRALIEKTPADTTILVDEAYYHYVESSDYESAIPLVKEHPNLIVTRTFSKIYGMAGLRCGYCVAQSYKIEQLRARQAWDSSNVMALVAARAGLEDPEQVANGRRLNLATRTFFVGELKKMGYETIPSQANFVMIDTKRPVVPLIATFKQRKVQVGRLFRALPNHLRVTVGKKSEMEAFLAAFREVMS